MAPRPRRAQVNSVVRVVGETYWNIVNYRDDVSSHRYQAVQVDGLGRNPRGPVLNLDSSKFTDTGKISRRAGRIVRKNAKEVDRGCSCQCCHHVSGFEPEPDE